MSKRCSIVTTSFRYRFDVDSMLYRCRSMSKRCRYDNRIDVVKFKVTASKRCRYENRNDIETTSNNIISTSNRHRNDIETRSLRYYIVSTSFRHRFDVVRCHFDVVSTSKRGSYFELNYIDSISKRYCYDLQGFCKGDNHGPITAAGEL